MARYKYIDTNPRLLAVDLARQLLPGSFEHALNHLLDHAIDLSSFDARFRNDETGRPDDLQRGQTDERPHPDRTRARGAA